MALRGISGAVTLDGSQTLTNKTLDNTNTITVKDANFTVQDDVDTTKQVKFQASGVTTGTTRTLTIPDASTTLVGIDTTQTLSNKTLDSPSIGATDVKLERDAANALAQRNGTNAQVTRIYNTFVNSSDYERLEVGTNVGGIGANTFGIASTFAGAGAARDIYLQAGARLLFQTNGANNRWMMDSAGHFLGLSDNSFDIGATGANRPRNLYLGSAIFPNGYRSAVTTKTANYTATINDEVILVDATAGAITITLPTASNTGLRLHIEKIDVSVNAVTISRAGSDTIEGATTVSLASQYNSRVLVAGGSTVWYRQASL